MSVSGNTASMVECLGGQQAAVDFLDPVVETMMVSISPILKICEAFGNLTHEEFLLGLGATLPTDIIDVALGFPDLIAPIIEAPTVAIPDLCVAFGLDLSMFPADFDLTFIVDFLVGMVMMPINFALDVALAIAGQIEMPSPTLDYFLPALGELGLNLPTDCAEASGVEEDGSGKSCAACLFQVVMLPVDMISANLGGWGDDTPEGGWDGYFDDFWPAPIDVEAEASGAEA